MAEANLEQKQTTETATTPSVPGYSIDAWQALEAERRKMLDAVVEHHFDKLQEHIKGEKAAEGEILKAVGTQEKAHEHIVLLAAKKTGRGGISLSDLRRFVPGPNHLNKARETLLGAKDKNGILTAPVLIEERRGENNELRVFVLESQQETK